MEAKFGKMKVTVESPEKLDLGNLVDQTLVKKSEFFNCSICCCVVSDP